MMFLVWLAGLFLGLFLGLMFGGMCNAAGTADEKRGMK